MNRYVFRVNGKKIGAYLLPGFLLYIFSAILPLSIAVYISLTDWVGGPNIKFIGLQNYVQLAGDVKFWGSFLNNLKFIGILLVTQIGFAFIFSIFIQNKRIWAREAHRRIIFLPAVLAPLVVGIIWQMVFNADYGLIAGLLERIGLGHVNIRWLDDPKLVIWSIALVLTWQYVGQFVVIIMAGMQNISQSVLESAEIDGASVIQKALRITFPLLKPTLSVCALLVISGCMKMFAIVFSMTSGGPGRASQLTALYAYDTAFKVQKLGYSSAISVGMVILSLALVIVFQLVFNRVGGGEDEA